MKPQLEQKLEQNQRSDILPTRKDPKNKPKKSREIENKDSNAVEGNI
jgi:hypothetical protein